MHFLSLRKAVAATAAALLPFLSFAQTPNFSQDIAPIIYSHCSTCHHQGAIAPFPLMSYHDVVNNGGYAMLSDVNARIMPPWPPDPNYSHLAHERVLTPNEIQLINDWVNNGEPQGDSTLAPPPPVFPTGSQIGTPDVSVQMEPYVVQSTTDEYRCFVIPSGLTSDQFAKAIEVIPGNRAIVHHVLIFYDTTGNCLQNDLADPGPGYQCFGGSGCGEERLVGIWVPGSQPQFYPQGMGIQLQANGWFVIQVHYAPGSQGQTDSTRVNVKFANPGFTRPVFLTAPLEHIYTFDPPPFNGPLVIPANQVKTFRNHYEVPITLSALAVGPHMHLLGQKIKAFGVDPANPTDTMKFIDIPKWNFHWQGAYFFPKVRKVPAGTVLHGEATYDNTVNNEDNPNDPPQTVTLGEQTTDEMFLVYFAYTYYLPGDENIVLDSAAALLGNENNADVTHPYFEVYPNPSDNETSVYLHPAMAADYALRLYDVQGRAVKEWWTNRKLQDAWLTEQIDVSDVTPGLYFLSLETKGQRTTRKLSVY